MRSFYYFVNNNVDVEGCLESLEICIHEIATELFANKCPART